MSELKYQLDMLKKPTWKFVNANLFSKDNLLYIQESGKFCTGKNYYTKRSGLDSYLIKFTISGKGILEYGGEKYDLIPDSVMFIDCKEPQNYYTDPNYDKWEMYWVHFCGKNVKTYYERFLENNNYSPVATMVSDNSLSEIIENIIYVSNNYAKDQNNEIIADNLLNTLLKECITKSVTSNYTSPSYVEKIAHYLRHHYNEEIDLDMLANEFNISKFHLQRTFKDVMGLSPAKYLSNIRINRAKRLLRGTNMPINEVAEHIGMEPNYFIQRFKSSENKTPKQYRNNWGG